MNAQDAFRRLREVISDSMRKLGIPGVAVGVISDDQEFSAGFGVTNVDHPLPVDADTLFQVGSTTKTFTGTAVMRLVEMGKLALDEPVRTYLPDFAVRNPDASARVTIRHLLIHTARLPLHCQFRFQSPRSRFLTGRFRRKCGTISSSKGAPADAQSAAPKTGL